MTERMLNNRIKSLLAIKEQIKALEEQQKALEDEIKSEFTDNVEEINTGRYLVRWTKVSSTRFDSTKLKKDLPDVYRLYTKIVNSRRFTVA